MKGNPYGDFAPFVPAAEVVRADILDRVRSGTIQPHDADKEAVARGLPSLSGRPSSSSYDPLGTLDWTPLMVAIWIAFRDMERVRDVSPDFRREWYRWETTNDGRGGFSLEPVGTINFGIARLRWDVGDSSALITAIAEIVTALIVGKIPPARGDPTDHGSRREILPGEWSELKFTDGDAARDAAGNGYVCIRLISHFIYLHWRPRKNPTRPPVSLKALIDYLHTIADGRRKVPEMNAMAKAYFGMSIPRSMWKNAVSQVPHRARGQTDRKIDNEQKK